MPLLAAIPKHAICTTARQPTLLSKLQSPSPESLEKVLKRHVLSQLIIQSTPVSQGHHYMDLSNKMNRLGT